jgi:phosphoesterase RecJ-like protein
MGPTPIPESLLDRLRADRRFLITSHLNPDGDAVGASVGLARLLRGWGASSRVWLRDPVPELYRPAAATEAVHVGAGPPEGFPQGFDSVIVLECPALDRSGLEEPLSRLPLINIDHHLGNELYGTVDWVDSSAPAVGEMVLRLALELGLEVDERSATPLFMALATDTGGFRFANATERAFEAGAELVRRGARPEEVSRWLYESRSAAAVCMLGEALSTLRLAADGRVATVVVTLPMYERCGASRSDLEGLIDYPRSIHGVEAVALLRELPEGTLKVSVRSRGAIDVESLARRHGGGGHRNAAGFNLAETDLETARQQVVGALAQLLRG